METIGEWPTSRRPVSVSIFRRRARNLRVRAEVFRLALRLSQCLRLDSRRCATRSPSWRPSTQ